MAVWGDVAGGAEIEGEWGPRCVPRVVWSGRGGGVCGGGGWGGRGPTVWKTGHYGGSRIRGGFGFGGGREAVVAVALDGVADGFAPAVVAESVDVFVLGDVDGLRESLHQVGDGVGGFGFYIAADNGGGGEGPGGGGVAVGKGVARGEVGQVCAWLLCDWG